MFDIFIYLYGYQMEGNKKTFSFIIRYARSYMQCYILSKFIFWSQKGPVLYTIVICV